jgi:hypothetical protein
MFIQHIFAGIIDNGPNLYRFPYLTSMYGIMASTADSTGGFTAYYSSITRKTYGERLTDKSL